MPAPRRILPIFSKILLMCLSIVIVTVLFQGGVTYSHSQRTVEKLSEVNSMDKLTQLKETLADTSIDTEAGKISKILAERSLERGNWFFLLNRGGEILSGQGNTEEIKADREELAGLYSTLESTEPHKYKDLLQNLIYCAVPSSSDGWLIVSVLDGRKIRSEMSSFLFSVLLVSFLILLVSFFLSYGLASSVSSPVKRLEASADRISAGDLSSVVDVVSGDEIGILSHSFFRMQQELNKLAVQSNRIAQGHLDSKVEFKGTLGEAFNLMQENLAEIISEVQQVSHQLGTSCNQILAASEEQASGSSEQAASVGETTATIEELSGTARQIAENSEVQAGMAESTQKTAEEIAQVMDEATRFMDEIRQGTETGARKIMSLGEKTQQIGKVLGIINEIAAETKMLSLNAAIEASKAGDSGKGFSVVATEIRKLAENVVKSTENIEQIVEEIQAAANVSVMAAEESVKVVTKGSEKIKTVESSLQEIVSMSERTTESAKHVSMATNQQKAASEQVVVTMRELSGVAKQMAASANETTSSATTLSKMAEKMKQIISRFELAE